MPTLSFFLAILLHGFIAALTIFFPLSGHKTFIDLEKPVYEVELVRMPKAPSLKQTDQIHSAEVKKPKTVVPLKKKTTPSGQKSPPPVKIAKKEHKKPAPTNQLKKPETAPQKSKTQKKKAPEPKSLAPTPSKVLEEAMAEIKAKASKPKKSVEPDYLGEAMAEIQNLVQARGSEQSASNRTGALEEIYGQEIKKIIKQNWRFPGVDDSGKLMARVELTLNSSGKIVNSQLIESSGRPDFDRSVMKAVAETTQPLPVTASIQSLEVTFYSQDLL